MTRPHRKKRKLTPRLPAYLRRPSNARALEAMEAGAVLVLHGRTAPLEHVAELPSAIPRPDEELERKSLWENLSEEAAFIVSLVVNTPAEAAEVVLNDMGEPTKGRIMRYLVHDEGWDRSLVVRTFAELRAFTEALE